MPASTPIQSPGLTNLPPKFRPQPDTGGPAGGPSPQAPRIPSDPPPPAPPPRPQPPRSLLLRVLQDRQGLIDTVLQGGKIPLKQIVLVALIACAVFGLALGVNSPYLQQPFVAALKLPAVMFGSLAVCFPAFYVLGALRGSSLRVREAFGLIGIGMGLRAALLVSLVPIVLFFSAVGSPYWFLLALGLGVATVAEVGFLHTLERGLYRLKYLRQDTVSLGLYRVWALVYLAVGAQFTWSLRPIIGDPSAEWLLFGGHGNMLTYALKHVFGG